MLNSAIWSVCMFLSLVFVTLSSPHFLIFVLILQALISSYYLAMLKTWAWSSYILFLVLLGGMLVLFCYVTSLAPKDILEEAELYTFLVLGLVAVASLMTMVSMGVVPGSGFLVEGLSLNSLSLLDNVKGVFSSSVLIMYLYTVLYLLLGLICVVNMMKAVGSPLRLLG
nr:NADH dehydrogenase subunit 6 [Ligia exotica]